LIEVLVQIEFVITYTARIYFVFLRKISEKCNGHTK